MSDTTPVFVCLFACSQNKSNSCGVGCILIKFGDYSIYRHIKRFCNFGRTFVKRFALCYRTVVCPACYYFLSTRYFTFSLYIVHMLRLSNVDYDDDDDDVTLVYCGETWYRCRPRTWPHCARCESSSPSPKGHIPIFGPCLLMDQDATW